MDGGKRRVDSRCSAGDSKNMIIDQIMLKFRPIAPKPVTAESSGHSLLSKDGLLKKKRVKRKYVRVKKKKKKATGCGLTINDNQAWLSLERTVAMLEDFNGNKFVVTDPVKQVSNWICFDVPENNRKNIISNLTKSAPPELPSSDLHEVDPATEVQQKKVVESWITVESVTGTCEDRRLLGFTDDEIWKNLEKDSCPGFISNGYDEVLWVNPAYRRMLDLDREGVAPPWTTEVVVWLGVKVEKSTVVKYLPAFSCTVRMVYRLSKKKTRMTVPCDVWMMDSGGFAWRLDVKSALSLGSMN